MENIQKYFQENPTAFGIALIIVGAVLFVWTLFNKTRSGNNRYRVLDFKRVAGEKIGNIMEKAMFFLLSIALIAAGIIWITLQKL
jgi:predicted negative regulator of RcsB-dependent stress response